MTDPTSNEFEGSFEQSSKSRWETVERALKYLATVQGRPFKRRADAVDALASLRAEHRELEMARDGYAAEAGRWQERFEAREADYDKRGEALRDEFFKRLPDLDYEIEFGCGVVMAWELDPVFALLDLSHDECRAALSAERTP